MTSYASCPAAGYAQIQTAGECEQAAQAAGKVYYGEVSWTNEEWGVPYCFTPDKSWGSTFYDKYIFNTATSTAACDTTQECVCVPVTSELTFWDPLDSSERMQLWQDWNAKCGDSFWATSFDWDAIAAPSAVAVCTGSMCESSSSTKAACDDTCSEPSAGCTFDFNMYATILVYSSQLRVATVVEGLPARASREQLGEAREQLGDVIDSLKAYQTALIKQTAPEYSAAGLIDTQVATVLWASNALSVASVGIMKGTFSGFVPAFNLNFYQGQLDSYFTEFQDLLEYMKEAEAIEEFNSLLKTKNANRFPSGSAVTLTNEVLTDLEDSDVPVPDDIPDGEEMATLQAALDSLNEELPLMGWGFWTE